MKRGNHGACLEERGNLQTGMRKSRIPRLTIPRRNYWQIRKSTQSTTSSESLHVPEHQGSKTGKHVLVKLIALNDEASQLSEIQKDTGLIVEAFMVRDNPQWHRPRAGKMRRDRRIEGHPVRIFIHERSTKH